MTVLAFDTLRLAKKLKTGGFSEQQAETAAEAIAETVGEYLVTREHFDRTTAATYEHFDRTTAATHAHFDREIGATRTLLDREIGTLKSDIDKRFVEFELRLLTRIGAMFGATIAILVALDKLL